MTSHTFQLTVAGHLSPLTNLGEKSRLLAIANCTKGLFRVYSARISMCQGFMDYKSRMRRIQPRYYILRGPNNHDKLCMDLAKYWY